MAVCVTVWEDCSGNLRVCRPTLLLYTLILVMWTSWDRKYRPHMRLRARKKQIIRYNETSTIVY
jgi:hypothetical protein